MDSRPEITDDERCQMCIHLGNDRLQTADCRKRVLSRALLNYYK